MVGLVDKGDLNRRPRQLLGDVQPAESTPNNDHPRPVHQISLRRISGSKPKPGHSILTADMPSLRPPVPGTLAGMHSEAVALKRDWKLFTALTFLFSFGFAVYS